MEKDESNKSGEFLPLFSNLSEKYMLRRQKMSLDKIIKNKKEEVRFLFQRNLGLSLALKKKCPEVI